MRKPQNNREVLKDNSLAGLERSLKANKPTDTLNSLGQKGPGRSQYHGMVWVGRVLKGQETSEWVGRVLKGYRTIEWVGRVLKGHRMHLEGS